MTTPFVPHLQWRYATKKFNPEQKIAQEDLDDLLESLRLSPSSLGLQPWKFVVVTDPTIRKQLREQAWDQAQITDASHLIVFCVNNNIDEHYVQKLIAHIAQERHIPLESLQKLQEMILNSLTHQSAEEREAWLIHQVYITLGVLLTVCAAKRIDACPMEGFDPSAFDTMLHLREQGLHAVALCAIGYRAGDDKYAPTVTPKVRWDKEDLFLFKN
jgi:nitroreductase